MVWYVAPDAPAATWEAFLGALQDEGLPTVPLGTDRPEGPGLMLIDVVANRDIESVQTLSHHGHNRVLVVLAPRASRLADTSWRMLAAGASDVLELQTGVAEIAAARIARWTEVDRIIASPLIADNLVGDSLAWIKLLRQIVEVARYTPAAVLLIGESGTGKELLARLIHTLDRRKDRKPMVVVDCTTVVPELAGSEFFGHERGAFTNALQPRDGAFKLADGATLFLDEVGELSLSLQAQLLRVVQEQMYKRVGSNQWNRTAFRLVCATNRDLRTEVEQGGFRRDLYHRLASWTFRVPTLRERGEDAILLARHFLAELMPECPGFSDPVRRLLLARTYDGNVRDLRQMIIRIAARHVGPGPISIGDIPENERPNTTPALSATFTRLDEAIKSLLVRGAGLKEIAREAANAAVRVALSECDDNLHRAARMLQVTDRALQMRASNGAPNGLERGELMMHPAVTASERAQKLSASGAALVLAFGGVLA